DPGSRSARAVDAIQRNVEHLTVLINNLQRISGDVLAGGGPTEQLIELSVMARDVARQLRQMAETRGVAVLVADDLPATISDPARLELILVNLVANGIKYSDPSKPARTVEIRSLPTPSGSWGIAVADNGLGIPAEALPVVFERFTRAHSDRDPELGIDGSGLGLAIVKDAIDAMGGAIACRSEVGTGTVFEIRLPVRRDTHEIRG